MTNIVETTSINFDSVRQYDIATSRASEIAPAICSGTLLSTFEWRMGILKAPMKRSCGFAYLLIHFKTNDALRHFEKLIDQLMTGIRKQHHLLHPLKCIHEFCIICCRNTTLKWLQTSIFHKQECAAAHRNKDYKLKWIPREDVLLLFIISCNNTIRKW